jgi:arylsulfatase A-like enzyme
LYTGKYIGSHGVATLHVPLLHQKTLPEMLRRAAITPRIWATRPWFHVVSIEPPHNPHTAPERFMKMFEDKELKLRPNVPAVHPQREQFIEKLRGYYAQIANLDHNIGRILQALEETGQLDNTIVFYFSDHGDLAGSHGRVQKSRPEYESSRIPLIIRYPRLVPQGEVSDALISGVDLLPTLLGLLGLCGANIAIPEDVEGEDLSGAVTGTKEEGAASVLLQYEQHNLVHNPRTAFRSLIQGDWFYTYYLTEGPSQLFHRHDDPYQMNNLIHMPQYGEVRRQMHKALSDRLDKLHDDFLHRALQYNQLNE